MKVKVLDKMSFDIIMQRTGITNETVEQQSDTFFISINDTQGTDEVPYFQNKKNVKVLFFDDVEKDIDDPKYGFIKAFTQEQAKEIVDFLEEQHGKQKCFLHCAAGVSRSGAVGTFVNDFFGADFFEFQKNNPYVHPNGHVLRTLKREFMKRNNYTT